MPNRKASPKSRPLTVKVDPSIVTREGQRRLLEHPDVAQAWIRHVLDVMAGHPLVLRGVDGVDLAISFTGRNKLPPEVAAYFARHATVQLEDSRRLLALRRPDVLAAACEDQAREVNWLADQQPEWTDGRAEAKQLEAAATVLRMLEVPRSGRPPRLPRVDVLRAQLAGLTKWFAAALPHAKNGAKSRDALSRALTEVLADIAPYRVRSSGGREGFEDGQRVFEWADFSNRKPAGAAKFVIARLHGVSEQAIEKKLAN